MEKDKHFGCDTNCCVQNLVLLYEGDEFRNYLEHHVANYKFHKRDVSITLQEIHSSTSSSSNVFDHRSLSKGANLLEHVNGIADATGSSTLPSWDGVVFPAHMTGALQESNRLWDWNEYLLQQQNSDNFEHDNTGKIEWMDIQPFFRTQAQQVDKKSTAGASSSFWWKSSNDRNTDSVTRKTLYAPLDGDVISLYYRKDLFEKYQIQVPRTWDAYRDVATFFHGKLWGPNNTTLTGSCVARKGTKSSDNGNSMYAYWASLVLSTITQTKGTSSGFLLDPETVEPILGDAMEETLRILADEDKVNDNSNNDDLNDLPGPTWRLNEGSCAMTYSWANELTTTMNDDFKKLNNIGVAQTPGSKLVLNRTSGHLETCTPELCPYGIHYDDIGIVNRPSYSAFGGWAGGVSNDSTYSKQHDMADFFSYISNPVQSLSDVLPNNRSHFVSPYRYSHATASNWIGAGFDEVTASEYTERIKEVNSENTVSEIRIPPGTAIRKIIDQEVYAYLLASNGYENVSLEAFDPFQDAALRSEITANMDRRIRGVITSLDTQTVIKNYQLSLCSPEGYEDVSMNYIDTNYRGTGWAAAALICFSSIAVILWILLNRKNPVMQNFQPILLIQSTMGFFFMGATLVLLGFDDSLFSKEILDITCMATPWIYVFGYTVFFSSIYSKIQVCTEIYKNPGIYERMMVRPIDSLKLFCRLFALNGIILGLWTHVDPLKWSRIEKTIYGSTFPDGTVESYGTCKSERFKYPAFAIALFGINLIFSFVAMLQALRCRLLVLDYHEMQWLQLCILPFFEAWIIGGPVIAVLHEQPRAQNVALLIIITWSTIAAAFAIFAPKEWYIRKNSIFANERKPKTPPISSLAGVRVLKHPKLESKKHVSNLQNRRDYYNSNNTDLEIHNRVLQERFRLLTEKEKLAVVGGIFAKEINKSQNVRMQTTMLEDDESSVYPTVPREDLSDIIEDSTLGVALTHGLCDEVEDLNQMIESDNIRDLQSETMMMAEQFKLNNSLLESISDLQSCIRERVGEDLNQMIESDNIRGLQSETMMMAEQFKLNNSLLESISDLQPCISERVGEDLNQMIESDNIRDLQSETMMMAEKFKLNTALLESISDLQPCISERVGEDLNQMIESDNIRDLQSETMMMAEKFKLNTALLESISDLQPCISERVGDNLKHDGVHTLDVPNATAISTSTAMTGSGSKSFDMPSDARICPSSKTNIASAGESSGGHIPAPKKTCARESEGYSMQQHAGEPSSDYRLPLKSNEDIDANKVGDSASIGVLNPPVPIRHECPKTPQTECETILSLRSSMSSTSSSVPVLVGLDSQLNTSQSSNNSKSHSLSFDGWNPSRRMKILLADLSDSTSISSQSHAESTTDSISSLEVMAAPSHFKVPMAKDIENLLNHHGLDAVEVAAEKYGDGVIDEKNGSRATNISTTRQKKRELEASRLSFRRSSRSLSSS